mmetsp:Transcript_32937/g.70652  ORF Transcript_32937/g.70652 Transcript_32937/m.70652 type:complete len:469 (-) Transcript_32937:124-1530(-)|eukprot:CAMPEP_0206484878 /NCGR_PEP_ID=MMETSP0324_2-20121206/40213_1 /ASSEMBLY_ACC=CAM_ASM_000836 /TAXON_ID=2866 /ORGANISM="Crypthecodinium cohnii, Strain Seligo" /LENGTH=468 /DNA_ID=CAMNT_0053963063 /DNA_START=190 /DNA_END=1596 /DNA_ORIENTATION=+
MAFADESLTSCAPTDAEGQVPKPSYKRGVDPRGPFFAVVTVVGYIVFCAVMGSSGPGTNLPWALNPTGLFSLPWYVITYILTIPAKEILNHLLILLGDSFKLKRIDEGESKVKKLEVLETIDKTYLAFNTFVEFVGMNQIFGFLFLGPLEHRLTSFNFTNGPAAFIVAMLVNDILYYPFHYYAHERTLYPYCHKQHHRQFIPFRGYQDAANQHPFEQFYGFFVFIMSLRLTALYMGLHAGAAWVAFLAWAVLNIANHLPYDSYVHLPLPYPAYPHDHQMHHRIPQCNYSTLTSAIDRAFGTFKPYRSLGEPEPAPAKKQEWFEKLKDPAVEEEDEEEVVEGTGRPDFFPSCWSFVWVSVSMFFATALIDVLENGEFPDPHKYTIFVKSLIIMMNAGLLCYAVEKAYGMTVEVKGKSKRLYTKKKKDYVEKDSIKEAVQEGHTKKFSGGKGVFRPNLKQAVVAKPFKRE